VSAASLTFAVYLLIVCFCSWYKFIIYL